MPGRIRHSRWPQVAFLVLFAILFVGGWWLEDRFLMRSGWQQPLGKLSSGKYEIDHVIDGDTIVLRQNHLRVRLQGVDTPETKDTTKPVEPWGPEATEYTSQFLQTANWYVRLEINGEAVDRYGRHLAFIWYDGRLLNEELVEQGLARAKTTFDFSPPLKARLFAAQQRARTAQRGIWSSTK